MENPPQNSTHYNISQLNPFICQFSLEMREISKNNGWYKQRNEETNVKGVNSMMNISFILLESGISKAPTDDCQYSVYVSSEIIKFKVIRYVFILVNEVTFSTEKEEHSYDC